MIFLITLQNDPGTSLFCKRFDGKWYLVALYNSINLMMNSIKNDFTTITDETISSY